MWWTGHPHLPNAVFVEIVVVPQDGYLVGHCSTYTRPVVYLWENAGVRKSFKARERTDLCSVSRAVETYSPSSEQMAAFDRLEDVGGQFRLAGQVGLGQSLLHPLNLHQTQRPLVPCGPNATKLHRR